MSGLRIEGWDEKYAEDFISLSVEWLEMYVSVEPIDLQILNNPHKYILDGGGEIFFALFDDVVVGTVAMINQGDNKYELAKLCVTPKYKGLKIGEALINACFNFAKSRGACSIELFTNSALIPAIGLYKKMGFVEKAIESNKYQEADMLMAITLQA